MDERVSRVLGSAADIQTYRAISFHNIDSAMDSKREITFYLAHMGVELDSRDVMTSLEDLLKHSPRREFDLWFWLQLMPSNADIPLAHSIASVFPYRSNVRPRVGGPRYRGAPFVWLGRGVRGCK